MWTGQIGLKLWKLRASLLQNQLWPTHFLLQPHPWTFSTCLFPMTFSNFCLIKQTYMPLRDKKLQEQKTNLDKDNSRWYQNLCVHPVHVWYSSPPRSWHVLVAGSTVEGTCCCWCYGQEQVSENKPVLSHKGQLLGFTKDWPKLRSSLQSQTIAGSRQRKNHTTTTLATKFWLTKQWSSLTADLALSNISKENQTPGG